MTTFPLLPDTVGWADMSPDGAYRWALVRWWSQDQNARRVTFVMLNPSTADGDRDDLTLRKCQGFARLWGFDGLSVVNLYGLRSTDPRDLRRHPDPVGRENERHLCAHVATSQQVVVAWGGSLPRFGVTYAWQALSNIFDVGAAPFRIGPPTLAGQPKHPSRLPYALQREPHGWEPGTAPPPGS